MNCFGSEIKPDSYDCFSCKVIYSCVREYNKTHNKRLKHSDVAREARTHRLKWGVYNRWD